LKKLFRNIIPFILLSTLFLSGCAKEESAPRLEITKRDDSNNGNSNGCLAIDTDQDGVKDCEDPDIDNDNKLNCLDFPLDLSSTESCNQDAFPYDRTEWDDSDKDGKGDNSDWSPLDPTEQQDSDEDEIGDNADPDDDNDGVPDMFDQRDTSAAEAFDIDLDGLGVELYYGFVGHSVINTDPDKDNDGIPDVFDDLNWDFNGAFDIDGDLISESFDEDLDGDGVVNSEDFFPYNPEEAFDNDLDKLGNNLDPDDDNDGYPDVWDDFPFNKTRYFDSDNDSYANQDDWAPYDPTEWVDNDGDGYGDNIQDAFPFDSTEWFDTDKDGIGDNSDPDIDGDGYINEIDAFPFDKDDYNDRDNDRLGDSVDPDDDNDGYPNVFDDFAYDRQAYMDYDNDNIKDFLLPTRPYPIIYTSYQQAQSQNSEEWIPIDGTGYKMDPDADNDGIPDYFDDLAWDAFDFADIDGDRIGNNIDLDDDGDGYADEVDVFPFDGTEWADNDLDRLGNNADFDDDNDGAPDVFDNVPYNGLGAFDIEADVSNKENDMVPNGFPSFEPPVDGKYKLKTVDIDYDGDGYEQPKMFCLLTTFLSCEFEEGINTDVFPFDGTEWADNDMDKLGNNLDPDDDNDGVPDVWDDFALDDVTSVTETRYADSDQDGTPNIEDNDLDGDGSENAVDVYPFDPLESSDNDLDTIGDNSDPDDDNDGVPDMWDDLPYDKDYWRDRDSDGIADELDVHTPDGIRTENDMRLGLGHGEDIYLENDIELAACIDIDLAGEGISISSGGYNEIIYKGADNGCIFNIQRIDTLEIQNVKLIIDKEIDNSVLVKATENPSEVGYLLLDTNVLFVRGNNRIADVNVYEGMLMQRNTVLASTDTSTLSGANNKLIKIASSAATALDTSGAFTFNSNILYWSLDSNQSMSDITMIETGSPVKYVQYLLNVIYMDTNREVSVSVPADVNVMDINFDQLQDDSAPHNIILKKNRINIGKKINNVMSLTYTGGSSLDASLIQSRENWLNSENLTLGNIALDQFVELNKKTNLEETKKAVKYLAFDFDADSIWLDFPDNNLLPYYPHISKIEHCPAIFLEDPEKTRIAACGNHTDENACSEDTTNRCSWDSENSNCGILKEQTPVETCEAHRYEEADAGQGTGAIDGKAVCNADLDNFCSWNETPNATLTATCSGLSTENSCNAETDSFCFWDSGNDRCEYRGYCQYNEPDFFNECRSHGDENACNADLRHKCSWVPATEEDPVAKCNYFPDNDVIPFIETNQELVDGFISNFEANEYPSVVFAGALPPILDSDGDFFPDDEDLFPTDVNEWADNDGDGIGDNADLDDDNDALLDDQEIDVHGTDPLKADTDGDGDKDGEEILNGTDPLDPLSAKDTDGDGFSDNFEKIFFIGCTDPHLTKDSDGDGLEDDKEYKLYQTDPCNPDSDNDGLTDAEEINIYNTYPKLKDSDGDKVEDGQEVTDGTNPSDSSSFKDTDGDGIPDAIDSSPFGANSTASFNSQVAEALTCEDKPVESSCKATPEGMCYWDTNTAKCFSGAVSITNDITLDRCFSGKGLKIRTSSSLNEKKKLIIPNNISTDCDFANNKGVFHFEASYEENQAFIQDVKIESTNADIVFSLEDAKVRLSAVELVSTHNDIAGGSQFYANDTLSELKLEKSTFRHKSTYAIQPFSESITNGTFNSNISSWTNDVNNGFVDWSAGKFRMYPEERVNPIDEYTIVLNSLTGWVEFTNNNGVFSTDIPTNCGYNENCFKAEVPMGEVDEHQIHVSRTLSTTSGKIYELFLNAEVLGGKVSVLQSNGDPIYTLEEVADAIAPKTRNEIVPIEFQATGSSIRIELEAASFEDGDFTQYIGRAMAGEIFLVEKATCGVYVVDSICNAELACSFDVGENQCIAKAPRNVPNGYDPAPVEKTQVINVVQNKVYQFSLDGAATGGLLSVAIGSTAGANDYGTLNVSGNSSNTLNLTFTTLSTEVHISAVYDRQGSDADIYGFLDNISLIRDPEIPHLENIFNLRSLSNLEMKGTVFECDLSNLYGDFDCLYLNANDITLEDNLFFAKNYQQKDSHISYLMNVDHQLGALTIDELRLLSTTNRTAIIESNGSTSINSIYSRDVDNSTALYGTETNNAFALQAFDLDSIFVSNTNTLSCETGNSVNNYRDIHPAYFEMRDPLRSYLNRGDRDPADDAVDYAGGDGLLCQ